MHRINDHKSHRNLNSHTSRYKIDKLVYYECYASISMAIARESEIKDWLRSKKIELIVSLNPEWRDLSLEWGQSIPPFDESKMRAPVGFNPKSE